MDLATPRNMPGRTIVWNQTQRDPIDWIERVHQALARGEGRREAPWLDRECIGTNIPVTTQWRIPCPSGKAAAHHYLTIDGLRLTNHQEAAEEIARYMALPRGDDALFATACTHAAILMAIRNKNETDNLGFIAQIGILIRKDGHPLGDVIRNHALVIVGGENTQFIAPPHIKALKVQVMHQMMTIMQKMTPVVMMDTLRSLEDRLRAAGFPA